MPPIACPTDEVLTAFLLGDLPEPAIVAIREHQEACPRCEERASRLDDRSDRVLRELRRTTLATRSSVKAAPPEPDPGPKPKPDAPLVLPGYDVEETPVGVGGMGVVYRARHRALDRAVAIKMIAGRSEEVSRLLRIEAKAVARLQHPNIVQIFEIGRGRGRPFLAMELVEGGSLAHRIDEGPTDPRWASEMVRALALAVDHAHRHGIVHCDLKPSNILLTAEGVPKIADFGVAKWNESDAFWGDDGPRRGTPRYMAPEQVDGGAEGVGPAADIYSLGVILYELLAGRVPHLADTAAETLGLVREETPLPPSHWRPGIPRDLDAVALKCLQKDPAQRYAGARALADDLDRSLGGQPIRGRTDGPIARARRLVGNPTLLATLFLTGALLAGVGASLLDAPTPAPPPHPTTTTKPNPQPEPAPPIITPEIQSDGSIRLGAAAASLSGPSLIFEHSFGNLGFWRHEDDRASWTFRLDEPARFRLALEYANQDGDLGNQFEIQVGGIVFTAPAHGTESWATYRKFSIGELTLPAGVHRVEVHPKAPLKGALFDLRAVIFDHL